MSKTPRRFTSELQILAAIDRNRKNGERSMVRAQEFEQQANALFREAWASEQTYDSAKAAFLRKEGNKLLDQSKKTRQYATMLLERKAKRLSERLAEYRTGSVVPLFGLKGVGDMSVEGVK